MKLLSIDAWRDGSGWSWNNWFHVADVPNHWASLTPRALLHRMREAGHLCNGSQGRIAIEDDGYNVVFLARGTREPLLAIEYGSLQS
jgi:hypothetical protein